jgi:hypothetical protein
LLTGPADAWPVPLLDAPADRRTEVEVHRLSARPAPGALHDATGDAHRRLGVPTGRPAQYLVRPDGYIAYRVAGTDLDGLRRYLDRWLTGDRALPG